MKKENNNKMRSEPDLKIHHSPIYKAYSLNLSILLREGKRK